MISSAPTHSGARQPARRVRGFRRAAGKASALVAVNADYSSQ